MKELKLTTYNLRKKQSKVTENLRKLQSLHGTLKTSHSILKSSNSTLKNSVRFLRAEQVLIRKGFKNPIPPNIRAQFNKQIEDWKKKDNMFVSTRASANQVKLANTKDTVFPKESSFSGTTPLVWTCYDGYTDMVQWLLRNDVVVDQCRDDGVSGLLVASQNGRTDIVKLLQRVKRMLIALDGNIEITQLLLENNADSNIRIHSKQFITETLNNHPKDGKTPLFYACEVGHKDIVLLLLDKGADTQTCRIDDITPLGIATENKQPCVVVIVTEHMHKTKPLL
ncbi:unnamed protein product [Mytilus edulis]|uniref:Uncharacterized protein n=1 Tax=Mytilus edulis TaxID=6550 RepID=A0A8S3SPN2_MYTED|nr:unnamed protein product [Mytilus edulis]